MNSKKIMKVRNICKIVDNYRGPLYPKNFEQLTLQDDINIGDYVPFYKSVDLKDGFIKQPSSFITREKFDSIPSGKIDNGAIVLSFVGRIDVAFLKYKKGLMSSQLREVVITEPNKVNKEWFYHWLKNAIENDAHFKNYWASNVVERNIILDRDIVIPSLEEQNNVVNKINLIQKLIDRYDAKFQNIWELLNKLSSTKNKDGEFAILKPILKKDGSQEKLNKLVSFKTGERITWNNVEPTNSQTQFIDIKYFVSNKQGRKINKEPNFKFGDIGLLLTTKPGLIRLDLDGYSDIIFNVMWKEKYKDNSKLLLLLNLINIRNKIIVKQLESGSTVIRSLGFKKEAVAFTFNKETIDNIKLLKNDKIIDYIVVLLKKKHKLIQLKKDISKMLYK